MLDEMSSLEGERLKGLKIDVPREALDHDMEYRRTC